MVLDKALGAVIGSTRYAGFDPVLSRIEIGWTFLARSHWDGHFNRAMKTLLLDHAFQFVETVVFFVHQNNLRSQRVMEKIGAQRSEMRSEERTDSRLVERVQFLITRRDWKERTATAPDAQKTGDLLHP